MVLTLARANAFVYNKKTINKKQLKPFKKSGFYAFINYFLINDENLLAFK
jgi:hypothetical protein